MRPYATDVQINTAVSEYIIGHSKTVRQTGTAASTLAAVPVCRLYAMPRLAMAYPAGSPPIGTCPRNRTVSTQYASLVMSS